MTIFGQKCRLYARWSLTRGSYYLPYTLFLGTNQFVGFFVETISYLEVLTFSIAENGHSFWFSTKNAHCMAAISGKEPISYPHMFPCQNLVSWIFYVDHLFMKMHRCQPQVLPKMSVHSGFRPKLLVVCPSISYEKLIFPNPHMFRCDISFRLIFGSGHLFLKKPQMLAFSIVENRRS